MKNAHKRTTLHNTLVVFDGTRYHMSITITSRKHGKKELQLFVHCGSFDQPDLQSLNDCKFFFFVLRLQFVNFGGM